MALWSAIQGFTVHCWPVLSVGQEWHEHEISDSQNMLITVPAKAFDDFVGGKSDVKLNKKIIGA